VFDVLVVGGGINGAVAAACLATRGARVALIDQSDFASGTSQESSNLAWGGIKYLESYEFGLVWKLCRSRNLLLRSYPSTVQEIRFFVAHERGFRHSILLLFLGTLLYWVMGAFKTQAPRLLSRKTIADEEPSVDLERVDGGFEYSDAYFHDNDARFVWGFVRRAMTAGAATANYVKVRHAVREWHEGAAQWVANCETTEGPTPRNLRIRARVLINAAGPQADTLLASLGIPSAHQHVFSKGIHLLVPRIQKVRRVLTFFADDGRLFFVIPMGPRTCIGTTDTREPAPTKEITEEDRAFVLDNINKRLALPTPLTRDDIVAERCGVRPLVVRRNADTQAGTEWSQLSRKHVVEVDRERRALSIFGGKLTDCINVGEEVAEHVTQLGVTLNAPGAPWFGEPSADVREQFMSRARAVGLDALTAKESSEPLSTRLYRRYGERAIELLEAIARDPREAEVLIAGAEYIRAELRLTARDEMVTTLDDFLRRRSKIALVMREADLARAPGLDEAAEILLGDRAAHEVAALRRRATR
jgi:glycerol-3-phosphate dehydrogenase